MIPDGEVLERLSVGVSLLGRPRFLEAGDGDTNEDEVPDVKS